MQEHYESIELHLTLSEAAKLTPGRPSPNCLWRWCREGICSKGGDRVHLKHARFGGKIFTTKQWLLEFGHSLAEADSAHFGRGDETITPADHRSGIKASKPPRDRKARRSLSAQIGCEVQSQHERAVKELEEAGL